MEESSQAEEKSFLVTLLLNIFLGYFGIHRFYTGYTAIGVIQLLTLGGCGLWALIDFVSICLGNYKDASNRELAGYSKKIGLIALILMILITILSLMSNLGNN